MLRDGNSVLPISGFTSYIQELSQIYRIDARFTCEAYEAIRSLTEAYMKEIFTNANAVAHYSKRREVQANDFDLILRR
jgi:histone H3/H4